ncbi:MAG TPA: hypothetical protein VE028_01540 [Nitratidesulfovibrio sp.]|nr:hypothetical protein [Nitratidesulfovibrio sp.]
MKNLIVIVLLALLSGCSVGMAMSGKKEPNLGAIRVGATRGEVEMHLGAPVEIREADGVRHDVYAYELGNEPSAGRAIGHGVMDVLTFGIWEVVGTPVEGFQGEKKYLAIMYDENDTVTRIGSTTPPVKKKKPEPEKVDT